MTKQFSRNRLLLGCVAVALAAVGGCEGGKAHELWNDMFRCHGDGGDGGLLVTRPLANSASETIVQASGGAQEDSSGLIQNSAVVGEPIQAGARSVSGAMGVRHGFTPPMPAGAPQALAQADSVSTTLDPSN